MVREFTGRPELKSEFAKAFLCFKYTGGSLQVNVVCVLGTDVSSSLNVPIT